MSTAYIYNGYGKYEEKDGKQGITLKYAGVDFFLPYQETTPIPDHTFREVDHDKSAPQGEDEGRLEYLNFVIPGQRIVEELTAPQVPVPNRMKGILPIEGKHTGQFLTIPSGVSIEGRVITSEIREVEATKREREAAEELALSYKKQVIQDYFQSKRERMAGGHGRLIPTGLVRVFMSELNVADIDDVSQHQRNSGGLDLEMVKLIIEETRKAGEINAVQLREAIESVRRNGGAQVTTKPAKRSSGTAEYKEAYDAAIAAGKTADEARTLAAEARETALAG